MTRGRSPSLEAAGLGHKILLAGQRAGLAEAGAALAFIGGGFPGIALGFAYIQGVAPVVGSAAEGGPDTQLGRGAGGFGHNISAASRGHGGVKGSEQSFSTSPRRNQALH